MKSGLRAALSARRTVLRLLAGLLLAMLTPGVAAASVCTGTFTHVFDGSGAAEYDLTNNKSLRIKSGTFTGGIKKIASTARICVDQGATFSPSNVNGPEGTILNYGTANLPALNPGTGFNIDNFGKWTFTSNVNFNGAVKITNRAGADVIFRQTVHIRSGSTILNDGRIITDGDLNLSDGTVFTNNFDVQMKGPFNTGGTFINYGRLHTLAFININSTANATNYCSWIADKGFNNNTGNTTRTYGLIFINWTGTSSENLFQNNGAFYSGPDAITYGWRFINNNNVTGEGRYHFRQPTGISNDQHTKNQGTFAGSNPANPIIFYDETPSPNPGQLFDQQNQTPTNTIRQYFERPRIDLASPQCSVAIRQILYDPNPPAVTYDYSDAPASYGTPVHQIVEGIRLGVNGPDWDGSAFNTANADGDDKSGTDDEDGVTLGTLQRGVAYTMDVIAVGTGGYLQAWIDYNGNGTFDTNEQIALNRQDNGQGGDPIAGDGKIRVTFTPPNGATSQQTYLRLRWSTQQNLSPTAAAPNGEVEDYAFTFGLAPENPAGGAFPSICPTGRQLITRTKSAAARTFSGSVTDPDRALGPIVNEGVFAAATNAANIGQGGILTLDLTADANLMVSQGADVILSIARDASNGRVLIEYSADNVSWTSLGSYGLGGTKGNDFIDDVLDRITFEAPVAIRYVRFKGQSGNFWVDGISYEDACGPPAALTVIKTSTLLTPGLHLPGADILYEITVTNTGYGSVDEGNLLIVDSLPHSLSFYNGSVTSDPAAPSPVQFTQDGAALEFFPAAHLAFSNAPARPTAFAQCTYQPVSGLDPAVQHICVHPGGAMAGGPSGTRFILKFRARIK